MDTTSPETRSPANHHDHEHGHAHGHDHVHGHCHDHGHARDAATQACDHAGHDMAEEPRVPPRHAAPGVNIPEGRTLTVRANCGLSGDIMLAGLADLAGLDDEGLTRLADELNLPALHGVLSLEDRQVNSIRGVGCRISLPHEHAHRNLRDILHIIEASAMPDPARKMAAKAFAVLAEAEAAVHGTTAESVTFHEVGALDSILDICLACRIFTMLRPARFVCSPLPIADGVILCAHGYAPAPAPAALRLLEGIPVQGFKGVGETVTPTALCLLRAMDADFGIWPHMRVRKSVISYGDKVFAGVPNGAVWALGEASAEFSERPTAEGSRR